MITLKTNEAFLYFAYSLCLGVCLGVVYDLFRAFRQNFKGKVFGIIIDIFYFLIFAVSIYLFSIGATFGEIRLFVVVPIISSLVLEELTVSKFITKIFVCLIGFIKSIFVFLFWPIKRLILLFLSLLKEKIFSNFHKKLLKNRPRLLYNKKRSLGREIKEFEEIEKYFS